MRTTTTSQGTRRFGAAWLLLSACLLLAGCPKGNADYRKARKAEALQDYDTALIHYERALQADPLNVEYKLKTTRIRFEAAQAHVDAGQRLKRKGELQLALAEFEKAAAIDPASPIAGQEIRATLELMASRKSAPAGPPGAPPAPAPEDVQLLEAPPDLMPLSRDPINLKITNDARIVFDTIAKLAGLTVVYDPDFQTRRITTELTNVTLEQALDVASLQAKAFWKPMTSNIIFVASDQQQKRKDYEELVVKTFYVSNTIAAQDLTEIVNGLRQVLELRRIQQINAQNAIMIRDTPDRLLLAEKIIRDIDKAKPEVVVQVSVLQARRDRMRDLGITPGSSAVLAFTPRNATGSGTGSTSTSNQIALNDLQRLATADYSITLPGASATALITDSQTKIIQNPEIRVVDGQSAKLRVGDRVPIATGTFGTGLGAVGTGQPGVGGFGGFGVANTQFQYQDVGVNIDITPRVHASREVSMKVAVEVSSVAGRVTIGGIEQPIISQRKIEHDIRLVEGEVSVLGGIVERSATRSLSGWPGLSKIPILRYFFSGETTESVESEVLIVLTPRIVRMPELSALNLRGIAAGTESNIRVRTQAQGAGPVSVATPAAATTPAPAQKLPAPAATQPPADTQPQGQPAAAPAGPARLRFEPGVVALKPGETATIGIVIEDVRDLFSIPMLLQYNPAVMHVEEVRHGGFLSGGTQEIAIVQRVDKERGQAVIAATRQPNTPGVNGTGTLVGIVVRGVAAGTTQISVVQISAKDSRAKDIAVVSTEAQVRVQ
jgi:general secretion pathway protein D